MHLAWNQLNLKEITFSKHKSLNSIALAACSLTTIPEGLFSGLNKLEDLCLDVNPITCLEANVFKDLDSLKQLSLSGLTDNLIVKEGVFSSLENLEYLNLASRGIVLFGSVETKSI